MAANLDLLRQMGQAAQPAGGGYRPLTELGEVLDSLAAARPPAYREEVSVTSLIDDHRGACCCWRWRS